MHARSYPHQLSGVTDKGLFEDVSTRVLESVHVGEAAGKVSTGTRNAFVGYGAGKNNNGGVLNTYVGYNAGAANTNASSATMVGALAGANHVRGSNVTFIGFGAGENSQDGNDIVGVGAFALRENVRGNGSVAIGYRAGERTLDGYYNTMIGTESGQDNRSGNYNTMAGYRSGRSAFLGNENTFFGAFSGYSNERGDGNCFIGYQSGERVTDGSYNVALGVGSMRNVRFGSCNVAIGPFVGAASEGGGTENVMIGARAGETASASNSVLVGSGAGRQMQGSDSVVIGYNAGRSLVNGDCNILIGGGADTLNASVDGTIAIGAIDTVAASYGVSIGGEVMNRGQYSVIIGHKLSSDTDNAVLVGTKSTIESMALFKDPITQAIKDSVTADGTLKIGIESIDYTQMTVSPCNEVYAYATAAVYTSNVASTQNVSSFVPSDKQLSDYDLRNAVTRHAIFRPIVFVASDQSDLSTIKLVSSSIVSSNIPLTQSALPNVLTASGFLLRPEATRTTWSSPSPFVANVTSFGKTSMDVPVEFVSRVAPPRPLQSSQNASIASYPLDVPPPISLSNFSFQIRPSLLNDGIELPSKVLMYAVTKAPEHGSLSPVVFSANQSLSYSPWTDHGFAVEDRFEVTPFYKIVTLDGSNYGVVADGDPFSLTLRFGGTSNAYVANSILLDTMLHTLNSEDIKVIPYGADDTPLQVLSIDPDLTLRYKSQDYSSNQVSLMIQENIRDYPDGAFSNLVADNVWSRVGIVSLCNIESTAQTLHFLDDVASNLSNIAMIPSLSDPAPILQLRDTFISLQELVFSPTVATKQTYETASNALSDWVRDNDPDFTEYDPYTSLALASNQGFYNAYFASSLWSSWSNTQELDAVFAANASDFESASTTLLVATSAYQENVVPTMFGMPSFLTAQAIPIEYATLYRKYFQVPRLFLTLEDVKTEQITILTNSTTSVPKLQLRVGDGAPQDISLAFTSNSTWTDAVIPSLPAQSFANHMIPVALPTLSMHDWIITRAPNAGIVLGLSNATNLGSLSYVPFDARATRDSFKLLLSSPQNSKEKYEATFSITYDDDSVQALPLTVPAVSRQIVDNEITGLVQYNQELEPFFACNTSLTVITRDGISLPPVFDFEVIDAYVPARGYTHTYSNIVTSNELVSVTAAPDLDGFIVVQSNITRRRYEYDFNLTQTETDNANDLIVSAYLNIDNPSESNTINYFDHQYVYSSNFRAYTSNITITDRLKVTTSYSNIHGGQPRVLYQTFHETPIISPEVTKLGIIADDPLLFNVTSYMTQESNVTVLDAYAPISTTHLRKNKDALVNLQGLDHFEVVQSNIGPVSAFRIHDLSTPDRYWVRACNVQNLTESVTINLNTSWQLLSESMTNASPSVVVIPQTVTLSDRLRVSFQDFIDDIETSVTLDFAPTEVVIEYVGNGVVVYNDAIVTRVPYSALSNVYYQACQRQPTDVMRMYFLNRAEGKISNIADVRMRLRISPSPRGQYFNLGMSVGNTSALSSNLFYHADGAEDAANLTITLNVLQPGLTFYRRNTPSISLSFFTMQDVINEDIYVAFDTKSTCNISYTVSSSTGGVVLNNQSFSLHAYEHNAYEQPRMAQDAYLGWQEIGEDEGSNIRNGTIWSSFESLYLQGEPILPDNVHLQLVTPLERGFLWVPDRPYTMMTDITWSQLQQNKVRYVPYEVGDTSNEIARWRLRIDNVAELSPEYVIPWKNYVSHFPSAATNVASSMEETRRIVAPTVSPGLSQDGIAWDASYVSLPLDISGTNEVTTSWRLRNVATNTTQWNGEIVATLYRGLPNLDYTGDNTLTLVVDQADQVSLHPLLPASSEADEAYVYLVRSPENGIIQDTRDVTKVIGKWKDEDARNGHIVYQNLGVGTTDSFDLGIATSPYTLSCNLVRVDVAVEALPSILSNTTRFLYFDSVTQLARTCNIFDNTIALDHGYLRIIDSNNIVATYDTQYNPVTTFPTGTLAQSSFVISEAVGTLTSDGAYPSASIDFVLKPRIDSRINPLIAYDEYRSLFVETYQVKINSHIDSNIFLADVEPQQNIEYMIDHTNVAASNLYDRMVAIKFEVQPRPSYDHPHCEFIPRTKFAFSMLTAMGAPLLRLDIEHSSWKITHMHEEGSITHEGELPDISLRNYEWNSIRFVNYDETNGGNVSLYVPDGSGEKNLLDKDAHMVTAIDMRDVRTIQIATPVYDPLNLLSCNVVRPVGDNTMNALIELHNSHTLFWYRNVELTYDTMLYGVNTYDETTHNLVIGKSISVRGVNNICIGNTFATSGQRSIIVGNNIGVVDGQTINDVYQSIVVGNDSFKNSIVRDIICIGN